MTAAVVVAEWPRNGRESIRVSISSFNGNPVIDCRTWYADGLGAMKPGRAGLTLGAKHLPQLADAIAKALAQAKADGMLE